MAETFTSRRFVYEDLDEVLELLRLSLGETELLQRTKELFSWKHLDNPFGESIVLVAEHEGRIVAMRALMRWDLRTPGGTDLRCVRPVDTATHPDYRRRGLFRRLTLEAIEEARATGINLVFNTPNDQSRPGYLKMGWSDVGDVKVMVRPSLRRIVGKTEGNPDPASLLSVTAPLDSVGFVKRAALGLRTPRSTEYTTWRFGSHPSARYFAVAAGPSAAIVRPGTRNGRTELVISDVAGPDPAAGIGAAVDASLASYVVASFGKKSPERSAARRNGLIPLVGMSALRLVCRPLTELDIDVTSLSNWDFALSDLELL